MQRLTRICAVAGWGLCLAAWSNGLAPQNAWGQAPTGDAASAATQPIMRTHACQSGKQAEIAEQLRTFYAGRNDVRIAADTQKPQVFVFAPTDVQEAVAQQLTAAAGAPPQSAAPAQHSAAAAQHSAAPALQPVAPAPVADETKADRFYALKHVRIDQLEAVLGRLLGTRFARPVQPAPGGPDYSYADFTGRRLELRVDRQRNGIAVRGPERLAGQFERLLQHLDHPAPPSGEALRVMPVRKADPAKVEQAVRAYQSGRSPAPPDSSGTALPQGQRDVNLAAYLQPAADAASKTAVTAIPATEGKEDQTRRLLRAIGSDVEVEMLPDLDVIILRGRERDVEEVSKIIEELERLSEETQPVVEIYPLKHLGGEGLSALVTQIQDAVAGGRQGRISIIPLVKPNALLLIGWGEAVKSVKAVIEKIDQPVAPEIVFRAFPLKYASAQTVRTTVQEMFATRTGLNGKLLASSDARTNSLLVQAPPQEINEVAALVEKLDRAESAAVNQTRIFKLKFALAADLAATLQAAMATSRGQTTGSTAASAAAGGRSTSLELMTVDAHGQKILRSGVLSDVQITTDVRLNTLIVTAPAESMGLLEALIQQIDSPVSSAQIKVFRIVNGDAGSMVTMLKGLLPSGGTSATTGPQMGVVTDEASLTPLRFSIDIRTNSIIAVGNTGDLNIVEALLLKLDEQDVQNRKSEVYRLKNSPARDVAMAISEFLRSKRQVESAAPGMASPFQQIESEVVVVAEIVSNSLIISATPRFFPEIHELVEKLDAQPPQVLIQVLIAEVKLDNFDEFGVELGLQDSLLYNRSVLGSVVTAGSSSGAALLDSMYVPGFNFNNKDLGNSSDTARTSPSKVGGQSLTNFSLNRSNSTRGFGGLVLAASSESVSVLIRAMKETHCIDILARPQVMTLDNQPAYMQVGQRVPRIAGTAITAATQVNSIVLENVGLILGVTPRISPEGLVVMELDAEKSRLGAEADGIPVSVSGGQTIRSPSIDVTTAQTTVSARSGETVILGGLISKARERTDRRVPILGDLPIVGNLFSYKSNEHVRSELLIILTPHVIRDEADAERAKQIETARMHWCLAEVTEVHGDIGVGSDAHRPVPVVYPDQNPRGEVTPPPVAEPVPQPAPQPAPLPTPPPVGNTPLQSPSGAVAPVKPAVYPTEAAPLPNPVKAASAESGPWPPPGSFQAVRPAGYTAGEPAVNLGSGRQ